MERQPEGVVGASVSILDDRTLRVAAAVFVFLAGVAFRLYRLNDLGVWMDEATGFEVAQYRAEPIMALQLFCVLQRAGFAAFGIEPWVLRLPAVVCGILVVPVMALLALRVSTRAAWYVLLFAAFSPRLVYYSQEARHYTLVLLLLLLALETLLRQADSRRPRFSWAVPLLLLLAVNNHLFAIFPAAVILAWSAWGNFRRDRGAWFWHAVSAAGMAAWWVWTQKRFWVPDWARTYIWEFDDRGMGFLPGFLVSIWKESAVFVCGVISHVSLRHPDSPLAFAAHLIALFLVVPAVLFWMARAAWTEVPRGSAPPPPPGAWAIRGPGGTASPPAAAPPAFSRILLPLFLAATLPPLGFLLIIVNPILERYLFFGELVFSLALGWMIAVLPSRGARVLAAAGILAVQIFGLAAYWESGMKEGPVDVGELRPAFRENLRDETLVVTEVIMAPLLRYECARLGIHPRVKGWPLHIPPDHYPEDTRYTMIMGPVVFPFSMFEEERYLTELKRMSEGEVWFFGTSNAFFTSGEYPLLLKWLGELPPPDRRFMTERELQRLELRRYRTGAAPSPVVAPTRTAG